MSIEEKRQYFKEYYESHKEERKKKHVCEICNGTYNINSKYYHFKSKKHMNALIIKQKDDELSKMNKKLQIIKDNVN